MLNLGGNRPVAGIFLYEATTETGRTMIVHAGDTLFKVRLNTDTYQPIAGSQQTLMTGLKSGGRTQGFYLNGKLYLLTGAEYLVYDGTSVKHIADDTAYCPLTTYQRKPAGGGEPYEKVNMISKWRRNRFVADGSSTTFRLDVDGIDTDVTPTAQYHITGESIAVKSFDAAKGTVTLSSAPRAPENAGTSNIEIKFAKTTETRKKIFGCTIFAIYGLDGSGDRVFLSGNDGFANMEWFSGLSDRRISRTATIPLSARATFPSCAISRRRGSCSSSRRTTGKRARSGTMSERSRTTSRRSRSRRACLVTARSRGTRRRTSTTIRCIYRRAACMRRLPPTTTTCRCVSCSAARGASTPN